MKILIIDNYIKRHDEHESKVDARKNGIKILEKVDIEVLKQYKDFDMIAVHTANKRERNYIFQKELGKRRIIFSGGFSGEKYYRKDFYYESNVYQMYEIINELIGK